MMLRYYENVKMVNKVEIVVRTLTSTSGLVILALSPAPSTISTLPAEVGVFVCGRLWSFVVRLGALALAVGSRQF